VKQELSGFRMLYSWPALLASQRAGPCARRGQLGGARLCSVPESSGGRGWDGDSWAVRAASPLSGRPPPARAQGCPALAECWLACWLEGRGRGSMEHAWAADEMTLWALLLAPLHPNAAGQRRAPSSFPALSCSRLPPRPLCWTAVVLARYCCACCSRHARRLRTHPPPQFLRARPLLPSTLHPRTCPHRA
jgi:hypothetical protein